MKKRLNCKVLLKNCKYRLKTSVMYIVHMLDIN